MENLENVIEAVLFVSGDPVPISEFSSKFGVKEKQILQAVEKLQKKYDEISGIKLKQFNGKLQFASNPAYVDEVAAVLNPIRQRNLTRATLETVAIVAYKQPITRMEIEETRGVGSDYAINILLDHKLIEIVGHKDTVGRPALFATTDEFLKRFNLSSIDELPDYNELMSKLTEIKENYSDSLFKKVQTNETSEAEIDRKLEEVSKSASDLMVDELKPIDEL